MHINYDTYEDRNKIQELVQDLRLSKNDTDIIQEIAMRLHKQWEENDDDL